MPPPLINLRNPYQTIRPVAPPPSPSAIRNPYTFQNNLSLIEQLETQQQQRQQELQRLRDTTESQGTPLWRKALGKARYLSGSELLTEVPGIGEPLKRGMERVPGLRTALAVATNPLTYVGVAGAGLGAPATVGLGLLTAAGAGLGEAALSERGLGLDIPGVPERHEELVGSVIGGVAAPLAATRIGPLAAQRAAVESSAIAARREAQELLAGRGIRPGATLYTADLKTFTPFKPSVDPAGRLFHEIRVRDPSRFVYNPASRTWSLSDEAESAVEALARTRTASRGVSVTQPEAVSGNPYFEVRPEPLLQRITTGGSKALEHSMGLPGGKYLYRVASKLDRLPERALQAVLPDPLKPMAVTARPSVLLGLKLIVEPKETLRQILDIDHEIGLQVAQALLPKTDFDIRVPGTNFTVQNINIEGIGAEFLRPTNFIVVTPPGILARVGFTSLRGLTALGKMAILEGLANAGIAAVDAWAHGANRKQMIDAVMIGFAAGAALPIAFEAAGRAGGATLRALSRTEAFNRAFERISERSSEWLRPLIERMERAPTDEHAVSLAMSAQDALSDVPVHPEVKLVETSPDRIPEGYSPLRVEEAPRIERVGEEPRIERAEEAILSPARPAETAALPEERRIAAGQEPSSVRFGMLEDLPDIQPATQYRRGVTGLLNEGPTAAERLGAIGLRSMALAERIIRDLQNEIQLAVGRLPQEEFDTAARSLLQRPFAIRLRPFGPEGAVNESVGYALKDALRFLTTPTERHDAAARIVAAELLYRGEMSRQEIGDLIHSLRESAPDLDEDEVLRRFVRNVSSMLGPESPYAQQLWQEAGMTGPARSVAVPHFPELNARARLLFFLMRGLDGAGWYRDTLRFVHDHLGYEDGLMFVNLLGATGRNTAPLDNVRMAINAFLDWKLGLFSNPEYRPPYIVLDEVAETVRRVLNGEAPWGAKIYPYTESFRLRDFAVAVDRWVYDAAGYFGRGTPDFRQSTIVQQLLYRLSQDTGIPLSDLQAAIWVGYRDWFDETFGNVRRHQRPPGRKSLIAISRWNEPMEALIQRDPTSGFLWKEIRRLRDEGFFELSPPDEQRLRQQFLEPSARFRALLSEEALVRARQEAAERGVPVKPEDTALDIYDRIFEKDYRKVAKEHEETLRRYRPQQQLQEEIREVQQAERAARSGVIRPHRAATPSLLRMLARVLDDPAHTSILWHVDPRYGARPEAAGVLPGPTLAAMDILRYWVDPSYGPGREATERFQKWIDTFSSRQRRFGSKAAESPVDLFTAIANDISARGETVEAYKQRVREAFAEADALGPRGSEEARQALIDDVLRVSERVTRPLYEPRAVEYGRVMREIPERLQQFTGPEIPRERYREVLREYARRTRPPEEAIRTVESALERAEARTASGFPVQGVTDAERRVVARHASDQRLDNLLQLIDRWLPPLSARISAIAGADVEVRFGGNLSYRSRTGRLATGLTTPTAEGKPSLLTIDAFSIADESLAIQRGVQSLSPEDAHLFSIIHGKDDPSALTTSEIASTLTVATVIHELTHSLGVGFHGEEWRQTYYLLQDALTNDARRMYREALSLFDAEPSALNDWAAVAREMTRRGASGAEQAAGIARMPATREELLEEFRRMEEGEGAPATTGKPETLRPILAVMQHMQTREPIDDGTIVLQELLTFARRFPEPDAPGILFGSSRRSRTLSPLEQSLEQSPRIRNHLKAVKRSFERVKAALKPYLNPFNPWYDHIDLGAYLFSSYHTHRDNKGILGIFVQEGAAEQAPSAGTILLSPDNIVTEVKYLLDESIRPERRTLHGENMISSLRHLIGDELPSSDSLWRTVFLMRPSELAALVETTAIAHELLHSVTFDHPSIYYRVLDELAAAEAPVMREAFLDLMQAWNQSFPQIYEYNVRALRGDHQKPLPSVDAIARLREDVAADRNGILKQTPRFKKRQLAVQMALERGMIRSSSLLHGHPALIYLPTPRTFTDRLHNSQAYRLLTDITMDLFRQVGDSIERLGYNARPKTPILLVNSGNTLGQWFSTHIGVDPLLIILSMRTGRMPEVSKLLGSKRRTMDMVTSEAAELVGTILHEHMHSLDVGFTWHGRDFYDVFERAARELKPKLPALYRRGRNLLMQIYDDPSLDMELEELLFMRALLTHEKTRQSIFSHALWKLSPEHARLLFQSVLRDQQTGNLVGGAYDPSLLAAASVSIQRYAVGLTRDQIIALKKAASLIAPTKDIIFPLGAHEAHLLGDLAFGDPEALARIPASAEAEKIYRTTYEQMGLTGQRFLRWVADYHDHSPGINGHPKYKVLPVAALPEAEFHRLHDERMGRLLRPIDDLVEALDTIYKEAGLSPTTQPVRLGGALHHRRLLAMFSKPGRVYIDLPRIRASASQFDMAAHLLTYADVDVRREMRDLLPTVSGHPDRNLSRTIVYIIAHELTHQTALGHAPEYFGHIHSEFLRRARPQLIEQARAFERQFADLLSARDLRQYLDERTIASLSMNNAPIGTIRNVAEDLKLTTDYVFDILSKMERERYPLRGGYNDNARILRRPSRDPSAIAEPGEYGAAVARTYRLLSGRESAGRESPRAAVERERGRGERRPLLAADDVLHGVLGAEEAGYPAWLDRGGAGTAAPAREGLAGGPESGGATLWERLEPGAAGRGLRVDEGIREQRRVRRIGASDLRGGVGARGEPAGGAGLHSIARIPRLSDNAAFEVVRSFTVLDEAKHIRLGGVGVAFLDLDRLLRRKGERIVPELPPIREFIDTELVNDRLRRFAQWSKQRSPVLGRLAEAIGGRAATAQHPWERALVAHQMMLEASESRRNLLMGLFAQERLPFDEVMSETGVPTGDVRITTTADETVIVPLDDVLRNPGKYRLTAPQRSFVGTVHRIIDEVVEELRANGIDIQDLGVRGRGEHYIPKAVKGKDGLELDLPYSGSRPGSRAAFEKPSYFPSVLEGRKAGIIYAHPLDAIDMFLDVAGKRIAAQQLLSELAPYGKTARQLALEETGAVEYGGKLVSPEVAEATDAWREARQAHRQAAHALQLAKLGWVQTPKGKKRISVLRPLSPRELTALVNDDPEVKRLSKMIAKETRSGPSSIVGPEQRDLMRRYSDARKTYLAMTKAVHGKYLSYRNGMPVLVDSAKGELGRFRGEPLTADTIRQQWEQVQDLNQKLKASLADERQRRLLALKEALHLRRDRVREEILQAHNLIRSFEADNRKKLLERLTEDAKQKKEALDAAATRLSRVSRKFSALVKRKSAAFAETAQHYPPEVTEALGLAGDLIPVRRVRGLPGLMGKLYPEPIAEAMEKHLTEFGYKPLRTIHDVNNWARLARASTDFGYLFLQGLPVLVENPKAWAKTVYLAFRSFTDPHHYARFLREHHSTVKEMYPYAGGLTNNEYFAAISSKRGVGDTEWIFTRTALGRAIFGQQGLIRRFAISFDAFLDGSKVLLWEAAKDAGWLKTNRDRAAYGRFLRNLTGTTSTRRLAVSPNQRILEGMLLFSPRYTRAAFALAAQALQGDRRAVLAITKLLGGMALAYAGAKTILYLTGQSDDPLSADDFDPTQGGRFLAVKIGNNWIGFGGNMRALLQFLGFSVASLKNPERWLSTDSTSNDNSNPLLKFVRGRVSPLGTTAFDLLYGKTYLGEDLSDRRKWLMKVPDQFLPFAVQATLEAEGNTKEQLVALAAQNIGLRSFPEAASEDLDARVREVMKDTTVHGWNDLTPYQKQQLMDADPKIRALVNRKEAATWNEYRRVMLEIDEAKAELGRRFIETQLRTGGVKISPDDLDAKTYRDEIKRLNEQREALANYILGRDIITGAGGIGGPEPRTPRQRLLHAFYAYVAREKYTRPDGTVDWDLREKLETEFMNSLTDAEKEILEQELAGFVRDPVERKLREDNLKLRAYWDLYDRAAQAVGLPDASYINALPDSDPRVKRYRKTLQAMQEKLRKENPEIDQILVFWGRVSKPITEREAPRSKRRRTVIRLPATPKVRLPASPVVSIR